VNLNDKDETRPESKVWGTRGREEGLKVEEEEMLEPPVMLLVHQGGEILLDNSTSSSEIDVFGILID
jgi:hypothetical protein